MNRSRWIGGAILASALLFCGTAAMAEDAPAGGPAGTWTGSFTQMGQPGSYRLSLALSGDGGTIDYPDQSCGGTLSKAGASGDSSFYIETITRGGVDPATGHGCLGGSITLIRSGDFYVWGWVGVHMGQPVAAYAKLTRGSAD